MYRLQRREWGIFLVLIALALHVGSLKAAAQTHKVTSATLNQGTAAEEPPPAANSQSAAVQEPQKQPSGQSYQTSSAIHAQTAASGAPQLQHAAIPQQLQTAIIPQQQQQPAVTTQTASVAALLKWRATAPAEGSLEAIPTQTMPAQQAQAKVVPLSRKSLQAGAAAAQAPKTADQEAMQAQVKSDALQRDTLKASELAAEVSPQASKPVVLLIHGGAQGGWVWSYPTLEAPQGVQGVLEAAGYLVYAPTLPYHEPGTQWSPSQGAVSAQNYVDYLKQFMEKEAITNAVVVGHSVSGVWLQLLATQAAQRIARVVFLNAIVLKDGESFVSNAVGPAQLFFTFVFTYPSFPQPLALPTGQVDLETWKRVMITLEGPTNSTFAIDTYNRLVPEPAGPQLEYPDFTAFYETPMPKFFIFEEDDVSLLTGTNRWMDFANRLAEANNGLGVAQTIKVRGDHQGMLTRPLSIAQGIVEAATRPLVN